MMTDEEILRVVSAHKEGKKIEFRSKNAITHWYPCGYPSWNFKKFTYRVSPGDAHLVTGYCFPKDISLEPIVGMVKIKQVHLDKGENPLSPHKPREWKLPASMLDAAKMIEGVIHSGEPEIIVREVLE